MPLELEELKRGERRLERSGCEGKKKMWFFILCFVLIFSTPASGSAQTLLPDNEIKALQKVASSLELDWDFSVDPCSGDRGWVVSMASPLARNLTCECNTTSCHVTSIQLKGLNLRGVLPDEFSDLTYLRVLDLTWNYLNGTIPLAWATLPLTNLSIIGNWVSGRIPKELGSITTLQALVLEDNRLEGPLPASLGNLINLDRLVLSANNFNGELPEALGNLKNLTDFLLAGYRDCWIVAELCLDASRHGVLGIPRRVTAWTFGLATWNCSAEDCLLAIWGIMYETM